VTGPAAGAPAPSNTGTTTGTATTCGVADFGHPVVAPNDAAGLLVGDLTLTMTGSGSCTLVTKPVLWLIDASTGRSVRLADANPYEAAHARSPLTVRHGQTITTPINESDGLNVSPLPAGCSTTPAQFHTVKIEFADGVKIIGGLDLQFPCRYPNAGDWRVG
jgi:hypothetical protein